MLSVMIGTNRDDITGVTEQSNKLMTATSFQLY